jgi:hypothetical protein
MRSLWMFFVLFFSLISHVQPWPASAQPNPKDVSPIEIVEVPLLGWLASRQHALPGTLHDFKVETAQLVQFQTLMRKLTAFEWAEARKLADGLKYQLVAIRADDGWIVVASDDSNTGRGPTFAVHTRPALDLVLQAPHVPFEQGTAEQAGYLLSTLKARAALISGAHRCASRSFTACDGKTQVCGADEPYRDSDVGHNNASLFHAAHVVLAEAWPAGIIVSLHGMRQDDDGVKTSVILSNGFRGADPAKSTPATRLRFALVTAIPAPGAVVSCNWSEDDQFKYRKLCGYTNVQGRHVNGDADVCRESMDSLPPVSAVLS